MTTNQSKRVPVYLQLVDELERMIVDNKMPRHARLPSESELASTHGVSLGTMQKALGELVKRNVIYRRHGQGTFVAPRSKKLKLPVITNLIMQPGETQSDYFRFFSGALDESIESDLPFEPMVAKAGDFMANVEDASIIYPDLGGVIFFRGFDLWKKADWPLRKQHLPMMYFGPDIYGKRLPTCCRVFYREGEIARMIVARLRARGFRRICFLGETAEIYQKRWELFQDLAMDKFDNVTHLPENILDEPDSLKTLPQDYDAVYCPADVLALPLIQRLERNLNFRIPRDLAVIGVDNIPTCQVLEPSLTTVDLCNYENGRLCMRKFAEYLLGSREEPFEVSGQLQLMERETC